jgi:predicted DNA-binding protein (UPF0251 family)
MLKEIQIKNAAKYLKVSRETLNKFLNDCKYDVKGNFLNINKLNKIIIKKSLANLNKRKTK